MRSEHLTPGILGMKYWLIVVAIVWVVNLFIEETMNPYYFSILMYAGINIILAVSLNLVNGFTGQFSMGHAGFMSVGAYTSAMVTTTMATSNPVLMEQFLGKNLVFLVALFAAGLLSAAIGYVVGMPSLRLKGDYLAIVTLGFGEIIRVILLNMSIVGGARGLPGIPQLATFGWVFTLVVLTVFSIWRLVHSPHGRVFLSVREDEVAAESMGVNTTQGKVRAFALGAFFAGIAGGLFGHYLMYLNPAAFDFNRSFEFIIMVVMGGMGSITGSVVAAIFISVIREALRPLQELTQIDFRMIIFSLLLIIMMLLRPNGMFGTREITSFFGRRGEK